MALPTREEINPFDDPYDGQRACEHFFGKTLEEAEAMIRESSHVYQEDLMWMGPIAFRYYLPAIAKVLREGTRHHSLILGGTHGLILWFAVVLEFRLEHEPSELSPVATKLTALCEDIADDWARFEGAESLGEAESRFRESLVEVYGNIELRYRKLRDEFSRLAADGGCES